MMYGTLYGIGVGPGDPELITLKGARLLSRCAHVFVPKARTKAESVALAIAKEHVSPDARVEELLFPMVTDEEELDRQWQIAAKEVAAVLEQGEDACFLTLGDPMLYSTYAYLLRALQQKLGPVNAVTVPGVTAFSAAAALTQFPIGTAKLPVIIVPTCDDLEFVRHALSMKGTVVLMKIGKRLGRILDLLQETGTIDRAVFVARAGMADEQIETDLTRLRDKSEEAGYLSVILVVSGCGS